MEGTKKTSQGRAHCAMQTLLLEAFRIRARFGERMTRLLLAFDRLSVFV